MKSIADIKQAFSRVWKTATHQEQTFPLMTIPPDRERDADCIVHDAIDELARLREEIASVKVASAAVFATLKATIKDAEERGAREMANLCDLRFVGSRPRDLTNSIDDLMQLWREGKGK